MQQLGERARGIEAPVIERVQGSLQSRDSVDCEQRRQRRVSVNQAARVQFEHLCNGAEVALGGSFGDERRAAVRHDRVTDEEDVVPEIAHISRVPVLLPRPRLTRCPRMPSEPADQRTDRAGRVPD